MSDTAVPGSGRSAAREVIATTTAPAAVGPYSQAVRVGNLIFTSGQVGIDPSTRELVGGGIASETRQVLDNINAILSSSGSGLQHVVRTTCYITDLVDLRVFNDAYAAMFGDSPPARATVVVTALPVTARVQIEAVAVVPQQ